MRTDVRCIALLVVSTATLLACQPAGQSDPGHELQPLLDAAVAEQAEIHAAALHVIAPGFVWEGAAGLADPQAGTKMTPQHPIRIASNTKTYVAAAALRLVEEGNLELDDPISAHLPPSYVEMLTGDGYRPGEITLRHLLTHTSGLYDHSDSENYIEAILAEPGRRWTRTEQVQAAMAWGDPLEAPGVVYSYCDTGYVLLGEVIEQASGQSLAAAVRSLTRFEQLGLNSSWWETIETPPADVPDRAHQFYGDLDVFEFDPSIDLYGGGGLVATVGDMALFLRGLLGGDVYARPDTGETMLTTLEGLRLRSDANSGALPAGSYRMGIWESEIAGYTVYQHTGFWGTAAVHVPELDLTVAATVNQNQGRGALRELVRQVIVIVGESSSPRS